MKGAVALLGRRRLNLTELVCQTNMALACKSTTPLPLRVSTDSADFWSRSVRLQRHSSQLAPCRYTQSFETELRESCVGPPQKSSIAYRGTACDPAGFPDAWKLQRDLRPFFVRLQPRSLSTTGPLLPASRQRPCTTHVSSRSAAGASARQSCMSD